MFTLRIVKVCSKVSHGVQSISLGKRQLNSPSVFFFPVQASQSRFGLLMTQELSEHSKKVVGDCGDIINRNASQIWKQQAVVKQRSVSED